ncbi:histidinol dehydrogenase [Microbacterium sp. HD4P20]|uniref:histidinol dehydrogenase n=1 Tax=Microbacterium sp. HD4P20 TaxID=2864874 RepID=UPI001C63D86E|nr:histidinol dehydrogenase [Microbacterium sp. HD4P20]MCP2637886.1 histidinol dehydrogenase [Microbacterium sp. HD4P20]
MRTSVLARVGTWFVALVVGAVYGLAGTIAHAYTIGPFPLGLVLGAIGCAALLLAVRLLTADRGATLATGLGMMVATLVFSGSGPGGSVIVPQTGLAVAWTYAVPILVALIVAWPERSRAAARPTRSP